MKTLNIWRKVFFALAAVVLAASIVVVATLGITGEIENMLFGGVVSTFVLGLLLVLLGLVLDSTKAEVCHKVGVAMHVGGVVLMAATALAWLLSYPTYQQPAGTILIDVIVLVGVVLYGFGWLFTLLMHSMARSECAGCAGSARKVVAPEEDVHVAAIMKWKKLYNEGIITEREFIDKRNEILGLRK